MRVLTPTLAFAANFASVLHRLDGRTIGEVEIDGDYKAVSPYQTLDLRDVSSGVSIIVGETPAEDRMGQDGIGLNLMEDMPLFGEGFNRFDCLLRMDIYDAFLPKVETLGLLATRWFYGSLELDLFDGTKTLVQGSQEYVAEFGEVEYSTEHMKVRASQRREKLPTGVYALSLNFDTVLLEERR